MNPDLATAPLAMTDVYFLVLPGTMLLDFAGTAETLQACKRFEHARPADLRRSALQPLRASAGATALAHPRSQKALRCRRGVKG